MKLVKPLTRAAWESVADDILSVLLTEQWTGDGTSHFETAVLEYGLRPEHFPMGPARQIAGAIITLRDEKRTVTWNTLQPLVVGVTDAQYTRWVTLADETRTGGVFRDNVDLLIQYGATFHTLDLLHEKQERLLAGHDRDTEIDDLMDRAGQAGAARIVGETADQSAGSFRDLMGEAPLPLVSTGLAWLDESVGGFGENELWYIAGPYKSSKTRLAYNMALQSARRGVSTAILSLENLKREIVAQFVSMLAIEWLLAQNKVPYSQTSPVYYIDPKLLLRVRANYRQWADLKRAAVDHGIDAFAKIGQHLRIYDRSEDHGALKDMTSIRRVIKRDKRLYNGRLYMVDHQGLVEAPGTTYEKTAYVSGQFQSLSRDYADAPITLVVLAQKSEENIKTDSDGYSPGVKGGGDSAANADVLLTTKPQQVEGEPGAFHNDRTAVRIALARWGGGGHKELVGFHPGSGLIMSLEPDYLNPDGIEW